MSEGAEYRSHEQRFAFRGIDLVSPPDAPQRPFRLAIAKNVRQVKRGTIQRRDGTALELTAAGAKTPWHSLRRLTDVSGAGSTIIAGVGDAVQIGTSGVLTQVSDAHSGNPLSLLPFKPPTTNEPWMAIGDSLKMRKVRRDGTVHQLGVPAPTVAPFAELDYINPPLRLDVDSGGNAASWIAAGTGSTRLSSAIQRSVWAGEDPTLGLIGGWFAVELASIVGVGPGTVMTDSFASEFTVEEVHPASPAGVTCTIKQIIFDGGGTSGWCTIVPTVNFKEFEQHALVKVGAQYTALTHTIPGPDKTVALRCYLQFIGATEGSSLEVRPSLYGYATLPLSGTLATTATGWNTLAAGTEHKFNRGTSGAPLNINLANYATGGRAVDRKNDEMHISINVSDLTRIVHVKVEADFDDGLFTKNYRTRTIRSDDLALFRVGQQASTDARADQTRRHIFDYDTTRRSGRTQDPSSEDRPPLFDPPTVGPGTAPEVDTPGGASGVTGSGAAQWSEIRFKMSDWEKVGEDPTKDLTNVIALRIVVQTNDGGTVDFKFDSWWIGGGYEPDVAKGAPYEYRYRYRCSSTGARSNWSPWSRSPVWPHRMQVRVQPTASAVAEVDKIDFQRRGGSVNSAVIIASTTNSANAFLDIYSDSYAFAAAASDAAIEGNINAQPFTTIGPPFVATVAEIAGSMVRHGSSGFDTTWAQGTAVMANGISTSIYRVHSTDVMELYHNVGSGTSLRLEIPEPERVGKPLPILFGPIDGWYYALGDADNPGRLYIFNQHTLDSTRPDYYADITDPTDQLQNGVEYNGRGFLWSTRKMFMFTPAMDSPQKVNVAEIIGAPGLRFRWALDVHDLMYWRAHDGIYVSDGGTTRNITRGDLQPLFPSGEGAVGSSVSGISAPDDSASAAFHRLSCPPGKYVYYDYPVSGGGRASLVLDRAAGPEEEWGWWPDTYAFGGAAHFADVGPAVSRTLVCSTEAPAKAYSYTSAAGNDAGAAIPCKVRTFAFNAEEAEPEKRFGHSTFDLDPGTASLTVQLLIDNFNAVFSSTPVTGTGRQEPVILPMDTYTRNVGLDIEWSNTGTQLPVLHIWTLSWLPRPVNTITRPTDYSDCGYWGPKKFRQVSIEVDTEGAVKAVAIDFITEAGTVTTVAANVSSIVKTIIPIPINPNVTAYEARIRATDGNTWKYFGEANWDFDKLPDMQPTTTEPIQFGELRWVQGVEIEGDTNNVNVPLTVRKDFGVAAAPPIDPFQHNGRGTKSYAFRPPFLAYMCYIEKAAAARIFSARFISEPEAALGGRWETQDIELGQPWGLAAVMQIEYASSEDVTAEWLVEGVVAHSESLAATATDENFVRRRFMLTARKGTLGKVRISTASGNPCRVRWAGTMLYVVSFGSTGRWMNVAGAAHRESGAKL